MAVGPFTLILLMVFAMEGNAEEQVDVPMTALEHGKPVGWSMTKKLGTNDEIIWSFPNHLTPQSVLSRLFDGITEYHAEKGKSPQPNMVFSPSSILTVLGMLLPGTNGESKEQLTQFFSGFNATTVSNILKASNVSAYNTTLLTANRVFVDASLKENTYLQAYNSMINELFGASSQLADFMNNAETERRQINEWVSELTQNKIQNLLDSSSIGASTRLLLVSASYFDGTWQRVFKDVQPGSFSAIDGTGKLVIRTDIKFMSATADCTKVFCYGYYELRNLIKVLEVPYNDGITSMVIFMPAPGKLANFEQEWLRVPEVIDILVGKMRKASVPPFGKQLRVTMPSFKLAAGDNDLALKNVLMKLGLANLFSNAADLSGITGDKSLSVSKVVHECTLDVNKKGTVAAAVTAAKVTLRSVGLPPREARIDSAFLFQIRAKNLSVNGGAVPDSDVILFTGRIADPSQLQ